MLVEPAALPPSPSALSGQAAAVTRAASGPWCVWHDGQVNRVCACGAIAPARGACPRCARPPDRRPTSTARGYGYDWRKGLRRQQLHREPLCQWRDAVTGGRCTARATDVDHIVPKSKGGADALGNLQSLCHAHHSAKTARENPNPSMVERHRRLTRGHIDISDLMSDDANPGGAPK